jgi:NAD+ synthase (glutamine-hydrolysing)
VIGLSGGLDSTLALLVLIEALRRANMQPQTALAVTMPGFGTSTRTRSNAEKLASALGVPLRIIPIEAAVRQHFSDISHPESQHDVVYENSQARERTQILMDLANQTNGLVVGTGDLSEAALGWCTFNGDHMSMYHVNIGVPKTLVRYLVEWCATEIFQKEAGDILLDIAATPISPELLPLTADGHIQQKTEDVVGPYELHDFFLYHLLRHGSSREKIRFLAHQAFADSPLAEQIDPWLEIFMRRFATQQFKRSVMPDGPKVGSVALSPRGDWRMPSDWMSHLY